MVPFASARTWRASSCVGHVLMTLAFGFVAYSLQVPYQRQGRMTSLFRSLSLEETVRRLRDECAAGLERPVASIEEAAETQVAAVR